MKRGPAIFISIIICAVGVKQMLGVNGAFNAALIKLGLMDASGPATGSFNGLHPKS